MNGTPFQKIPAVARTTGLSTYFLRRGVRDGTVPHIKSGTVYLVNVPALLRRLDVESTAQDRAVVPLQDQERGALDG